jgi:tetratricopeptide (TPR) repeat protein
MITLLSIVATLILRARGPNRTLYAALFSAVLVWGLHAGLDWDWEMPAVTLWVFAIGGTALAATTRKRPIAASSLGLRVALALACFGVGIVPGLVMVSEARLDESAKAYERGDCSKAVDAAQSASSALGRRPQPHEIIAYCRLHQGRPREAVRELDHAVRLDPDNWEYHYDLAVARGAAGLDPRPEARKALRLNPRDPEAQNAFKSFHSSDSRTWKRKARTLLRGASPFYLSDR